MRVTNLAVVQGQMSFAVQRLALFLQVIYQDCSQVFALTAQVIPEADTGSALPNFLDVVPLSERGATELGARLMCRLGLPKCEMRLGFTGLRRRDLVAPR